MPSNEAFMLNAPFSAYFGELPTPRQLNDDEVLIDVKKTGICGTDIHFYTEGRNGSELVTEPIVLGHESSGVISKVGAGVDPRRIGEKVAIEPWTVCRVCEFCKSGRYQLCPRCSDLIPPRRGTLCRYFKVPSDLAYTLPDNLGLEDGAMMEPLAVAVHAVRSLGKLSAGQSVVVFGCGPVGLLCMAVARALGATQIIAVDKAIKRLEFATQYAATDSFTPPEFLADESVRDYSARASNLFRGMFGLQQDGSGIDLVVDASGAETCLQMGLLVAKNGATFVQVGVGRTDVEFPISVVMNKELTIKGSLRYGPGDHPLAINLAASGKVDLKPLVTHRFEFADAIAAFEMTKRGVDSDGNVVLKTMISGPSDKAANGIVNGLCDGASPAATDDHANGIADGLTYSSGHLC